MTVVFTKDCLKKNHMRVMNLKAGSQYDARPCVSLWCVSALYCEDDMLLLTPSDAT